MSITHIMNSNKPEKKAAWQKRDKMIMETLHVNRTELKKLRVIEIGLIMHTGKQLDILPDYDSHMIVELEEGHKSLNDFTDLWYFLEELLQAEINLLLMQPKTPYLDPALLESTEFISISPVEEKPNDKPIPEPLPSALPEEKLRNKLFSVRFRKPK